MKTNKLRLHPKRTNDAIYDELADILARSLKTMNPKQIHEQIAKQVKKLGDNKQ